jgi:hypothetical protein
LILDDGTFDDGGLKNAAGEQEQEPFPHNRLTE